jgi:hypothetical protein
VVLIVVSTFRLHRTNDVAQKKQRHLPNRKSQAYIQYESYFVVGTIGEKLIGEMQIPKIPINEYFTEYK